MNFVRKNYNLMAFAEISAKKRQNGYQLLEGVIEILIERKPSLVKILIQ